MGEEPTISIPLTVTEWLHLMDATYFLSPDWLHDEMPPHKELAYKALHAKIAREFHEITQRTRGHVEKGGY